MSQLMDFDLKERVRAAVDIVDVIGRTLELRPQGRNFVARCPWHDDSKPSLTINQQRQTWKCWPCDIGGDVFSFIMRRDGVDFPGAMQILAESAGIDISIQRTASTTQPGSPNDKATLLSAMRFAVQAAFDRLETETDAQTSLARDYLQSRGFSDQSRKQFMIGFAPNQWSWLLDSAKKAGFSAEVLLAAGLARARNKGPGHYDFFRGRLIFPIFDLQNRPIALGGRLVPGLVDDGTEPAKYFNGPETRLYSKSRELYGLNWARDTIVKSREVLVMEGYTDVIATHQAGIRSAVAVLGTALGDGHIRMLRRFADRVVLVLDGDAAGKKRADEVLELFVNADVDLRILTLPDGSDPADFVSQQGPAAFQQLVTDAPDAIGHKLDNLINGVDLTQDTHRATTAIETILSILAKRRSVPGDLKLQQLLVRLARTFGLHADDLRDRLKQLRRNQRQIKKPLSRKTSVQPDNTRGTVNQTKTSLQNDPNDVLLESAATGSEPIDPEPFGEHTVSRTIDSERPNSSEDGITPFDRELFEILIEDARLAPLAIEAVDPASLKTEMARRLMQAYQELDLEGRDLSVDTLLLSVNDEALKNAIVTMDDRIRRREGQLTQTPAERYSSLLERYHEKHWVAEKRRNIATLNTTTVSLDEETELLKQMFDGEKAVQGILNRVTTDPPTD